MFSSVLKPPGLDHVKGEQMTGRTMAGAGGSKPVSTIWLGEEPSINPLCQSTVWVPVCHDSLVGYESRKPHISPHCAVVDRNGVEKDASCWTGKTCHDTQSNTNTIVRSTYIYIYWYVKYYVVLVCIAKKYAMKKQANRTHCTVTLSLPTI